MKLVECHSFDLQYGRLSKRTIGECSTRMLITKPADQKVRKGIRNGGNFHIFAAIIHSFVSAQKEGH